MNSLLTAQCVYNADCLPVIARGISYNDIEVEEILKGPVKSILNDKAATDELKALLSGIATTGFQQSRLEQILTDDTPPDNWRVGEAIAEAFVTEKGKCVFPWPTGRDLKNPNSSPAGCDLTGFQSANDDELPYRFAFGEVKTSEQKQYPPSVMASLGKQLQGLRDDSKTKDDLCRYLGFHAPRTNWEPMYKSAVKRYLKSNTEDVAVYGVLVRDVAPNAKDISARAAALSKMCPNLTTIEIYGLYLPQNTISNLKDRAVAALSSGGGT